VGVRGLGRVHGHEPRALKWLARVFASAVVRRIAYVLVALVLAWAGIGKAQAQSVPPNLCDSRADTACTRQQAWEGCNERGTYYVNNTSMQYASFECRKQSDYYQGWLTNDFGTSNISMPNGVFYWEVGQECPAGSHWNDTTKQCNATCPSGEWNDPTNPAQCLSPQKCLARNGDLGSNSGLPRPSLTRDRCVAGCKFSMPEGQYSQSTSGAAGQSVTVYRGVMEYTGDACGASPIDPNYEDEPSQKDIPPQECVPVAGQTMCQKSNGDQCYSSSTGRQICWRPGETGVKTGDTVTTTTTTINNGGTTTIITTTVNYQGGSGADAGDTNSGEDGDGIGKEDGEEDGSAAGGIGCDAPPVTTGDPLQAKQIEQNWVALCRGETESDNMRADADTLNALADGLEPQEIGIVQDVPSDGLSFDQGLVTLGSGSCPSPPAVSIGGRPFEWPSQFCDILAALRLLFIAATLVHALRVVVS